MAIGEHPNEIVVIGGGVVGMSAAYHAARAGARVTVVDRSDAGQATAAGAGIIAPGTSLRDLPSFLPLATPAVRFYPELLAHLAEDGETSTGYEVVGSLHVATTDDEANLLPQTFAVMRERAADGVPNLGDVAMVTGAEAKALFPPLADLPGAIHVPEAARVDGRKLRDALRAAAEKRGVTVRQGEARPVVTGGRVTGVTVAGDTLSAGAVVVAGGAWSHELADALGVPLPTEPQRGQILHMTVPGVDTGAWPIVQGYHSQYLLCFRPNRIVAGATRETGSGFDYRLTVGGTHDVLTQALRVAPGLAPATISEWRIGMRPASPDGNPILGPAPGLDNVFLATGHGPSGLQLGPYSGALAADLALGQPSPLDLSPYSAGRFR